jgi:hypothetical protein
MEHLDDVGHVESHFGPLGDGFRVSARLGARFTPNVL